MKKVLVVLALISSSMGFAKIKTFKFLNYSGSAPVKIKYNSNNWVAVNSRDKKEFDYGTDKTPLFIQYRSSTYTLSNLIKDPKMFPERPTAIKLEASDNETPRLYYSLGDDSWYRYPKNKFYRSN